ncbi:hypothetical protein RB595_002110 [Gaeumannomyces hyphopodioides]
MKSSAVTLGLLLGAASAVPAPSTGGEPCGKIAPTAAEYMAASPNAPNPRVPARMAWECLQTVPNKVGPAQDMIRSLKTFVNWQSTLPFLKAPPRDYGQPSTDIQQGLDDIADGAQNGRYKSEFDFQMAIVELLYTAHDGHFYYRPDALKAFSFRNSMAADIVSVSRDGQEAPMLYHEEAIRAAMNGTNNSTAKWNNKASRGGAPADFKMPPAIIKINGQDAIAYTEKLNLKYSSFQDQDSQWNSYVRSYSNPAGSPVIAASLAYLGPTLTLAYEDGTIKTSENMAVLRTGINFTGIRTGEDFYRRWCTPDASLAEMSNIALEPKEKPSPAMPDEPSVTTMYVMLSDKSSPPAPKQDLPPPAPTIEGYPYPVVRDDGANITAGYFLNGTGYDKVAVLSVLAFSADSEYEGDYLNNFQQTVERFLAKCKDAGKERLVIDVSSNGGGFVVAGYDLFAQLFPNMTMFQANNMRLTDSMVNIARVGTLVLDKTPNATDVYTSPEEQAALSVLENSEIMGNLVPGSVYGPDGRNFLTVEDILAPVSLKGDYFSAYQKTPFNDTNSSFNLTGTGNRSNPPPAVFAPEDVVLLTDGTCGSTCTLMAYLLIKQAGVRATVVGGRPRGGVMQSVAGVEGAQVYRMESIAAAARAVLTLAPPAKARELAGGEVSVLGAAYALTRASRPGSAGSINAKNAFGMGDAQMPRQFLYQAANCRVWYTPQSVMDPDANWKTAVDATWGDSDKLCVDDSIVPLDETAGQQPMDPLFQLSVDRKTAGAAGSRVSWAAGVVAAVGAALAVLVV